MVGDFEVKYEFIDGRARAMLGLPFGCDDNDVARGMLRLMGRPVPVSVLGDTGVWFRQLANEVAMGSGPTAAKIAAREAMTVLPRRNREILRLMGARSAEELESELPVLVLTAMNATRG